MPAEGVSGWAFPVKVIRLRKPMNINWRIPRESSNLRKLPLPEDDRSRFPINYFNFQWVSTLRRVRLGNFRRFSYVGEATLKMRLKVLEVRTVRIVITAGLKTSRSIASWGEILKGLRPPLMELHGQYPEQTTPETRAQPNSISQKLQNFNFKFGINIKYEFYRSKKNSQLQFTGKILCTNHDRQITCY